MSKNQPNPGRSLLEQLIGPVEENDQALTKFTPVEQMPDCEPWRSIKQAYQSNVPYIRVMAVLMNGTATSKKSQFLLSQGFLKRYLKQDPNYKGSKNPSGNVCNALLAPLTRNDAFLYVISGPKQDGPNEYRAGVYTICNAAFTSCFDWWNNP